MNHVMIALLPISSDWCNIDLPHMTLVYSGKIEDHSPSDFNDMAKDAASIAMLAKPITLAVTGIKPMGPPEDVVAALMLRSTTELMAMRNFVERWDRSEYPEFVPHATIGPYPVSQPLDVGYVAFDRIMVSWGTERITFWLR